MGLIFFLWKKKENMGVWSRLERVSEGRLGSIGSKTKVAAVATFFFFFKKQNKRE